MRTCIYPGTFDPVTNGHLDLIRRAATLFDHVIVGVAVDNYKNRLFSDDERVELVREVTKEIDNVSVEVFAGLLMDFCREKQAQAVVRGLRAVSDYEYELQMALMNKTLNREVETVFLMSGLEYSFISSTIIKDVAQLHGDISAMVPAVVAERIAAKYK